MAGLYHHSFKNGGSFFCSTLLYFSRKKRRKAKDGGGGGHSTNSADELPALTPSLLIPSQTQTHFHSFALHSTAPVVHSALSLHTDSARSFKPRRLKHTTNILCSRGKHFHICVHSKLSNTNLLQLNYEKSTQEIYAPSKIYCNN